MSFLDLYQGDQDQAARMQPNEGTRLPSGFGENLHAAWSDGLLFSQSVARSNARNAVLGDYIDEIRAKTGNDISKELDPDAGAGTIGPSMFDQANARVAKLKESYPDLDLAPLSEDEIDKRAVAKAQAAHRTYQDLQAGEKTAGGSVGSFLGSAGSAFSDPVNIAALAIAPESVGILSAALKWGALAGVSQGAIEFASDSFKNQVQPGYTESGEPIKEIGGAFIGGAVLGGGFKALGNAWTRVKTGQWPTSVRDAGNVIESEANVADTNIFPGVQGEVAHREALVKTIDDILAGRPVDVSKQITPEMESAFDAYHGSPHDFDRFDTSKIGTGEGAQAYGHGLYFAENENVAAGYADRLGASKISNDDLISGNYELGPNGNTYRVKINADKEKFLDLDKPLSEQSEFVRKALEENPDPVIAGTAAKWGHDVQNMMRRIGYHLGPKEMNDTVGREAVASRALADAGIPGIKYLDEGSRDAGEGTRNFVVFDDKHVEITHKNGKPVNAETRQAVVDQAMGLPPKQPELPLAPETEPMAPKRVVESGPQPQLQTTDQMTKTLTDADHQDAIRADIDRAIDANARTQPANYTKDEHGTIRYSNEDGEGSLIVRQVPPSAASSRGMFVSDFSEEAAGKFIAIRVRNDLQQTLLPSGGWVSKPEKPRLFDTAEEAEAAAKTALGLRDASQGKGDIMVPGLDDNGNHTMVSVNNAVDEVDAYKKAATDIQACATMQEAAE